jgi:hypothetical protein
VGQSANNLHGCSTSPDPTELPQKHSLAGVYIGESPEIGHKGKSVETSYEVEVSKVDGGGAIVDVAAGDWRAAALTQAVSCSRIEVHESGLFA